MNLPIEKNANPTISLSQSLHNNETMCLRFITFNFLLLEYKIPNKLFNIFRMTKKVISELYTEGVRWDLSGTFPNTPTHDYQHCTNKLEYYVYNQ